MGKFLDLYKKTERSKGEALAFDVLVSDLLSKDKIGSDKFRELGSKNMEQSAPTNFIPSMFYIFMYVKQDKEQVLGEKFYDVCPLILCTSVDAKSVKGINFNFLPNDVRAAVLDILVGDFKDFYDNVEKDAGDDLVVNNDLGVSLTKGLDGVLMYIKEKIGLDISACVRTYSRRNMLKTRMIEYDQWKYIPFLTFKDAVRGINLAQLQMDLVRDQQRQPSDK